MAPSTPFKTHRSIERLILPWRKLLASRQQEIRLIEQQMLLANKLLTKCKLRN